MLPDCAVGARHECESEEFWKRGIRLLPGCKKERAKAAAQVKPLHTKDYLRGRRWWRVEADPR